MTDEYGDIRILCAREYLRQLAELRQREETALDVLRARFTELDGLRSIDYSAIRAASGEYGLPPQWDVFEVSRSTYDTLRAARQDMEAEVHGRIASMECDETLKRILIDRYICGRRIPEIADRIGYTERETYRKHRQALLTLYRYLPTQYRVPTAT